MGSRGAQWHRLDRRRLRASHGRLRRGGGSLRVAMKGRSDGMRWTMASRMSIWIDSSALWYGQARDDAWKYSSGLEGRTWNRQQQNSSTRFALMYDTRGFGEKFAAYTILGADLMLTTTRSSSSSGQRQSLPTSQMSVYKLPCKERAFLTPTTSAWSPPASGTYFLYQSQDQYYSLSIYIFSLFLCSVEPGVSESSLPSTLANISHIGHGHGHHQDGTAIHRRSGAIRRRGGYIPDHGGVRAFGIFKSRPGLKKRGLKSTAAAPLTAAFTREATEQASKQAIL